MNLQARTSYDIELISAIESCRTLLASAIALVYTPDWCGFVELTSGSGPGILRPSDREASRFEIDSVFEARVFNEDAELRWLHTDSGKGRAALISENDISGYLNDEIAAIPVMEVSENSYLLWGEGTPARHELPSNWSRLAMARIGSLDVPYPLNSPGQSACQKNDRLYLLTREYLAIAEDEPHGNVSVIDERLLRIVDEHDFKLSKIGMLLEQEAMQ